MTMSNPILDILTKYGVRIPDTPLGTTNIACYCPFHKGGKESRPSFYVYVGPPTFDREPGMSFCHTCNQGWTLPTLLKDLQVPRRVADTILKDLPIARPIDRSKLLQLRTRQLNFDNPHLPEELLGVYDWCPTSMLRMGFPKDLLMEYDIGYDKEHHRITFPIRDHRGHLVGISGRAQYQQMAPRYLIYQNRELGHLVPQYKFNKGKTLWNIERAYPLALSLGIPHVIVVEGFKQALRLIQNGYKYTVAAMGSYLTWEQRTLLLRMGCPIYLFFDNNYPGQHGQDKAIKLLKKESLNVYAIKYPSGTEGLQPDDLSEAQLRNSLGGIIWTLGSETLAESLQPGDLLSPEIEGMDRKDLSNLGNFKSSN